MMIHVQNVINDHTVAIDSKWTFTRLLHVFENGEFREEVRASHIVAVVRREHLVH